MSTKSHVPATGDTRCSIGRALEIVGDRWNLLILREALNGETRFSEFKARLHVASDVLTQRLTALVEGGVLEKRPYREAGARSRMAYHLTASGRDLVVVFGALQQWGDHHCPHPDGPLVHRGSRSSGRALRVAFVDDGGTETPLEDVDLGAPAGADATRPVG
ncbi:helix-turn-helix domain-containing protein [Streptomyces sp. SID5789]|uniref:winged helix-turn-helix transcriptional regulator n=1 Tax=Streptomyces sp. SID5789 TaxID=2690310 RepID=UPI00136ECDE9|nr:helix-turn-helix domain-containing protein [Streptomyces sp. SID5789]MZE70473.1 transcriptional regulator [Streptomyces sp. SID5789]